ncbi:Non-structural polyprotein pORF1 [Dissostichus eleginoides]|uniref:Non-structural polyprotein pORF1 n=1 Tax=Dissostichus eleginoides TaxID=100907 RepID=A0AAD9FH21_DISEL|nr:Non-structural polyprotein pORF1 [Dissostichus eleginoides]
MATVEARKGTTRKYNKPLIYMLGYVYLSTETCAVFFFKHPSESVSAKGVDQRIGVSGIATAFRIISRFCLNRICLEELNQLCPGITGMTLEESLEPRGQSIDCFFKPA